MLLVLLIVLLREQLVHYSSQPKNFLQHVQPQYQRTNSNNNMQEPLEFEKKGNKLINKRNSAYSLDIASSS